MILVYEIEKILNQFDGNRELLRSIFFDQNGYLATTCSNPTNKLYLFSPDGSFTGKSLTTPQYPRYIGFDSKGRFILISPKNVFLNQSLAIRMVALFFLILPKELQ